MKLVLGVLFLGLMWSGSVEAAPNQQEQPRGKSEPRRNTALERGGKNAQASGQDSLLTGLFASNSRPSSMLCRPPGKPRNAFSSWPKFPKAGQRQAFLFNDIFFYLRYIPAGSFLMGYASNKDHSLQVTITRGFWMFETPVTQAQYKAVMGSNPSRFQGCNDCPVENVSWEDARNFAHRISRKHDRFSCTSLERGSTLSCNGWRLPTEAEWEYAARAKATGPLYGKIDEIAWISGNSGDKTQPVGKKKPNAWGLHDMIGNVTQWTMDLYMPSLKGLDARDPLRDSGGTQRVRRGASWSQSGGGTDVAKRRYSAPTSRNNLLGFRLLLRY